MVSLTKDDVIAALADLNSEDLIAASEKANDFCRTKTEEIVLTLALNPDNVRKFISSKIIRDIPFESFQEKHLCLNIYLLILLGDKFGNDDILSVQETKKLKLAFRNVATLGIFVNIVANLPLHKNLPDDFLTDTADEIKARYTRLTFALDALVGFAKNENYRSLIIPDLIKGLLVGLYQILHCPLKKPTDHPDHSGFHMTEDYYNELLRDRNFFKTHFEYLATSIYKPIYVRETMLLVRNSAPVWLKKAVSTQLHNILTSRKGVEYISAAIFDGTSDDSTRTWKALDTLTNLIFDCKKSQNFPQVCQQVVDLLEHKNNPLYERIFVCVTKKTYLSEADFCERVFGRKVFDLLLELGGKASEDGEDVTDDVKQVARVLHSLFVERHGEKCVLPINLLEPVVDVLFGVHVMVHALKAVSFDTKDVIVKYLKGGSDEEIFKRFDAWLFNMNSTSDVKQLVVDGEKVVAKPTTAKIVRTPEENSEVLMDLLKSNVELLSKFFAYLLNCLVEDEKYFKSTSRRDLLAQEDDFVVDEATQRKLLVFKHLATLAENKDMQDHISNSPTEIINYIETVFKRTVKSELLKKDGGSEGFRSVFTLCMVLQLLVENGSPENFEKLVAPLKEMEGHCGDEELKNLLGSVLEGLTAGNRRGRNRAEPTELDLALEEICDPLLAVRAHGLVTLIELVRQRDGNAMERIHYVQNIFEQNLKTDDSFVYLRAIEGLAAVSLTLPDSGLAALCEEYTDFSRKDADDSVEVRMKVGEVLVRVTRMLGEMTPHYKNLLLNTFLAGTRDEDYLIRASSLSNLAEVCEVLAYKLGSISTEILTCVHAIIATDKCVEPRRAAVTVIRQLLRGLGEEMIFFLKDAILPIYQELRLVYRTDKDDVVKLQAQLALEELNENMKEFVFPTPRLGVDVRPIVMK